MVLPLPDLGGLGLSQTNDARSQAISSGAVISGGQGNRFPWYVWLGLGVVVVLWLIRR